MKNFTQLTTPMQKIFACLAFVGLVIFVKMFLPFIMVAGLLLVTAVFYKNVWDGMNQLSWFLTKSMISNNKIYYLEKGYDFLQNELNEFREAVKEVGASQIKTERKLVTLIDENKKAVSAYQRADEDGLKRELEAKVSINEKQINNITPQLEMVKAKFVIMQEIEKMREIDLNIFKHELDAKIDEYETMKDLSTASDKASKFLGDDNYQKKVFKESLKQLESSVTSYMSNIETVNSRMMPKLQSFNANMAYNEENGRAIIAEYEKSRLTIETK